MIKAATLLDWNSDGCTAKRIPEKQSSILVARMRVTMLIEIQAGDDVGQKTGQ